MNTECRDEITLVEANCLLDTIENYLRKYKYDKKHIIFIQFNSFFVLNRFCSECKLKVLEAYDILIDNTDCKHRDKKGFCPALYEGKFIGNYSRSF